MKVSEIENNLNNLADFYIDRIGDEEYEKHLKVLIIKNFEKLKAGNKKLREALEFYADSENWYQIVNGRYNIGKIWVYQDPDNKYMNDSITLECGALARKTLREIGEAK